MPEYKGRLQIFCATAVVKGFVIAEANPTTEAPNTRPQQVMLSYPKASIKGKRIGT